MTFSRGNIGPVNFGDPVPDINSTTTLGKPFKLSDYRGRYVVLYFFPKAFTPGCTAETREFADNYDDIKALGAEVVGISTDDLDTQCDFAQKMKVRFPMLGDPKLDIVSAYAVKWPLFSLAQRVTIIVDPEGRLGGYFHHELLISRHVKDVVAFLKKLQKPAGVGA